MVLDILEIPQTKFIIFFYIVMSVIIILNMSFIVYVNNYKFLKLIKYLKSIDDYK